MNSIRTRSAVMLVLSLGLGANAWAEAGLAEAIEQPLLLAQADTGNAVPAARPAPAAAASAAEPETVPSLSTPGAVTPLGGSDAAGNTLQRSVTSGYELAGAGIGSASVSQNQYIMTSPVKGRGVRFDNGIFLHPAATVGLGYNSNVLGTPNNKTSSSILVLRPEVVAEAKSRGDRYTASYSGNYGRYASSSPDDFYNHDFWLAGDNYFTTRARLGWGVGYVMRSDPRGSTDRVAGDEPDRWRAPVARVLGIYGAPKALGRIELEGSWMQKRYQNNRQLTEGFDLNTSTVAGRFFYRVMPATSLVFEARNTWTDYVLDTSTNDNRYSKLLVGATWEATAKTTGFIKVGRAYKNFDTAGRSDPSAGTWEAGVSWAPRTYSVVRLETEQNILDSTGVGNFTMVRGHSLNWEHKWASYFTSSLSASQVTADYDGIDRKDKTNSYGIGVFREVGRNFRVGASWNHIKRNSSDDARDFTRNVQMLTLEVVL